MMADNQQREQPNDRPDASEGFIRLQSFADVGVDQPVDPSWQVIQEVAVTTGGFGFVRYYTSSNPPEVALQRLVIRTLRPQQALEFVADTVGLSPILLTQYVLEELEGMPRDAAHWELMMDYANLPLIRVFGSTGEIKGPDGRNWSEALRHLLGMPGLWAFDQIPTYRRP